MSVRVQVILEEKEAARFKSQALKESKSLSAWLRDAGRKMLNTNRQWQTLTDQESLRKFFKKTNEREQGSEPSWEEHKRIILEGSQGGVKL
jgi:hypothetical protein